MIDLESRYRVILVRCLQLQLADCLAYIRRYERRHGSDLESGPTPPEYDVYIEYLAMRDALNYYIKRFRADIVAHNLLYYI